MSTYRDRIRPRGAALLALVPLVALVLSVGAWAATARVAVLDDRYEPRELTITAGDSVTWVWEGANPHSVTSADGSFPDSHPGCSPATPGACGTQGSVHTVTLEQPGTFTFFCTFHGPSMSGVVTVEPPPDPEPTSEPTSEPTPDPEPTVEPPPDPEPTSEPTPEPTPSPSAQPTPEPPPPPSPEPVPDTGPSPSDVASPDRSSDPAASASPSPTTELEAFPSPSVQEDPDDVGEVAVDVPGGGGPGRTGALVLAAAAVAGSLGAFTRVILFGEPWEG
ncbi:MAG TPA: plastocyanin/azurin family copper-binding protein [Nitriliruptorales bacterium]